MCRQNIMTSNSSTSLKYVDHTYRDFSRYVEEGGELVKHKKSGNNFPARLHRLLSSTDRGHTDAISWMPHGRAWKVHDKNRLISDVIPKYFVCKKFESFTRQLNGWGFKRLHQSGPDFGCYYHECFLRGLPDLTCLIRRLPTNLGKSTPYVEGEPNFYIINEQYPLPPPPREAWRTSTSAMRGDAITVKIGSKPPRVMPAAIDRPPAPPGALPRGRGPPADARRPTSAELPSFESSPRRENEDQSSPVNSGVHPSSSVSIPSALESSAPRLMTRASTEPLASAHMPLNLSRHPSAPYYYPPSHPGYPQHPQYPPRYFGMNDQYSGVVNPNQCGYYPADHQNTQFHHPQGLPSNEDYLPSRYSEYNHHAGYAHRDGFGNIHPSTSSAAMMMSAYDGLGSNGPPLRRQDGEMSYSNGDEAEDEFAPIPIQYSPRSMMRKSDGNSVPKFD
ncbi:hypothetical protein ACHAXA_009758 [Cyclostephanos tholiformis]|uniref:HSF-type DNA-binding domain-containing protein n=1 Tax=Cyclostephanos tholiformis TaxID=382380 RepID=A0ABD3SH07_9STRA